MTDPKKELTVRWFEEVWNNGRESAIDEMLSTDAIIYGLSEDDSKTIRGPAGFKPFYRKFREAFPDMRISVGQMVCEGDIVVALCHVSGTHRGETLGFTASNKPMKISGTVIARVRDGKIVESWNHFDFLGMYQQLGAVSLK